MTTDPQSPQRLVYLAATRRGIPYHELLPSPGTGGTICGRSTSTGQTVTYAEAVDRYQAQPCTTCHMWWLNQQEEQEEAEEPVPPVYAVHVGEERARWLADDPEMTGNGITVTDTGDGCVEFGPAALSLYRSHGALTVDEEGLRMWIGGLPYPVWTRHHPTLNELLAAPAPAPLTREVPRADLGKYLGWRLPVGNAMETLSYVEQYPNRAVLYIRHHPTPRPIGAVGRAAGSVYNDAAVTLYDPVQVPEGQIFTARVVRDLPQPSIGPVPVERVEPDRITVRPWGTDRQAVAAELAANRSVPAGSPRTWVGVWDGIVTPPLNAAPAAFAEVLPAADEAAADRAHHSPVRQFLDLSTVHLPRDVMDNLTNYDGVTASALGKPPLGPHGALMWVPPDTHVADYEEVPEEILTVQRYARARGCDYVMFDRDADTVDDLPTWEW